MRKNGRGSCVEEMKSELQMTLDVSLFSACIDPLGKDLQSNRRIVSLPVAMKTSGCR
jgi:hypothetical protein